jgi:hypothetical protein
MITPPALINLNKPGSGQEPTNLQRRNLIGGTLAVLLSSSLRVMAKEKEKEKEKDVPNDPFIVLLKGLYQPVPAGHGPDDNLGLSQVNLSDGSYSRTLIYPIFGIAEKTDQDKPIGKFYVQFVGNLCAYDLPGGALAMSFNSPPECAPPGFNGFVPFPDGMGGSYLEGCPPEKPQGSLILGRPFSVVAESRPRVSPTTQSFLLSVPVMVPMSCLHFISCSFDGVGDQAATRM